MSTTDVLDWVVDRDLGALSREEFDALPYGSVCLDRSGKVTRYNAFEAGIARRDADTTIGRGFFEEIAPCTDTAAFRGRLDEIVRAGKGSVKFDYRFLFPWGTREVRIQLWVPNLDEQWIFVLPVQSERAA